MGGKLASGLERAFGTFKQKCHTLLFCATLCNSPESGNRQYTRRLVTAVIAKGTIYQTCKPGWTGLQKEPPIILHVSSADHYVTAILLFHFVYSYFQSSHLAFFHFCVIIQISPMEHCIDVSSSPTQQNRRFANGSQSQWRVSRTYVVPDLERCLVGILNRSQPVWV